MTLDEGRVKEFYETLAGMYDEGGEQAVNAFAKGKDIEVDMEMVKEFHNAMYGSKKEDNKMNKRINESLEERFSYLQSMLQKGQLTGPYKEEYDKLLAISNQPGGFEAFRNRKGNRWSERPMSGDDEDRYGARYGAYGDQQESKKEEFKMNKRINEDVAKISRDILDGLKKNGFFSRIKEVGFEAAMMAIKGKADFVYLLSKTVGAIVSPTEFNEFRIYVDRVKRTETLSLYKQGYGPAAIVVYMWAKFKNKTTAENIDEFIEGVEEAARIYVVVVGDDDGEDEEETNDDVPDEDEKDEEEEEEEEEPENNDEIPESTKIDEKKKMPEAFKKYLEKKKMKGKKGKKGEKADKEDKKGDKKEEKKSKKMDECIIKDSMTKETAAEVLKKKKIFLGEEVKDILNILKNPLNLRTIIKESKTDANAKELFLKIVEVVEKNPEETKKVLGESKFYLIKTEIASSIGMMKAIKGQNRMLSEEIYWERDKK